jgi:hypothetical protein
MSSTYRGVHLSVVITEITSTRKFKTPRTSVIRVISRFWVTDLITELGQSALGLAYVHFAIQIFGSISECVIAITKMRGNLFLY